MKNKQEINCNISSCKYNNCEDGKCILETIQIEALKDTNIKHADESMCASFKCCDK